MSIWSTLKYHIVRAQFRAKDRVMFYEALSSRIEAGVAPYDAINRILDGYSHGGTRNWEPKAIIMADVVRRSRDGGRLAPALRPWIPSSECTSILAAEIQGKVSKGLDDCVTLVEGRQKMTAAIWAGVTKPIWLSLALGLGLSIMADSLIPSLLGGADPATLSGTPWLLYWISEIINRFGTAICAVLLLAVIAIAVSLPRWTGRRRMWIENLPAWCVISIPYRYYKLFNGVSFIINLAVLRGAGGEMKDHLGMLAGYANPWLHERITACIQTMNAGTNFGLALHKCGYDFPDRDMNALLGEIAQDANVEAILAKWGQRFLRSGITGLERLSAIGLSCYYVFFYAILGFVLHGGYSMTLAITDSLGR